MGIDFGPVHKYMLDELESIDKGGHTMTEQELQAIRERLNDNPWKGKGQTEHDIEMLLDEVVRLRKSIRYIQSNALRIGYGGVVDECMRLLEGNK